MPEVQSVIPRVVVFVNDPSSAERRIDFAVFLIVLWSYGRKRKYSLISGYGCLCVHMRVCVVFFFALWKPLDTPGTYCSNAVVNTRTWQ